MKKFSPPIFMLVIPCKELLNVALNVIVPYILVFKIPAMKNKIPPLFREECLELSLLCLRGCVGLLDLCKEPGRRDRDNVIEE